LHTFCIYPTQIQTFTNLSELNKTYLNLLKPNKTNKTHSNQTKLIKTNQNIYLFSLLTFGNVNYLNYY
jgi:hypothetical protein